MRIKKLPTLILLISCLLLNACVPLLSWNPTGRIVLASDKTSINEKEVRLTALEYKIQFENYYKNLYGDAFWQLKISDGPDYETYVKEFFVFRELKTVMYLEELAIKENVKLTQAEEERLKEASAAWFLKMNEDERSFTNAGEKDIYNLLHRYFLAEKMIEKLLEGKAPEISAEESRVADIEVIRVSDRKLAENLAERLQNGESFLALAQTFSESSRIRYSVSKGELCQELEDQVFSMKDTEISDVIEVDGNFYLVRMENSLNALQSGNHQENLLAVKRFEAWKPVYDQMEAEISVRRNEEIWESISLSVDGDFPFHSLFDFFAQ